jgi:hypothetical protein
MTNRILRFSGLGLAVLTAGAMVACGSDDPTPAPGTAGKGSGGASSGGSAGSVGVAGIAGTGTAGTGTAGTGTAGTGGGGAGFACAGTLPTAALITNFTGLVASGADYTFTGGVLGGTFTYKPGVLTLDTAGDALTIKGTIQDYYGFGLYFNTCYNAGAYTGISFKIKGDAGTKGKLGFRVQTNANTVIDNMWMKGGCVAANPADPYPSCHSAEYDIPVTASETVVTVMFSDLMGGAPSPTVDNKQIMGLEWAFKWDPNAGTAGAGAGGASGGSGGASAGSGGASAGAAGKGGSGGASGGAGGASGGTGGASAGSSGSGPVVPGSFQANITIDDVMFIGGPPAGGAGGASGSGAGGASAGSGGASAGSGGASAGSGGKGGSGGTAG